MTVKTIVCDLDGVLIWHHPHDPSKDWRKNIVSGSLLSVWEDFQRSPHWQRCLRDHTLNTRLCFLDYLADHEQGKSVNGDANTIIDTWLEYNNEVCEPALRKVEAWQKSGFECVVATNQDGIRKLYIERWLRKHGLNRLPRFISCDLKMAKPDERYFRYVQKVLGREPEELLLIDDTEENIEGARKAGWMVFLVDESYRLDPSKWNSVALFPLQ